MTIVLRLVAAALGGLLALPLAALAEPASGWANGFHSRARLVAGWTDGAEHWVGVEIALDPGYKTYWRNPGESGLPPRFDWAGSQNLESVEVRWPAPARTEDAGGVAHVYPQSIVFPVRARAADPGAPVDLHLALEYGVCKEICIPAHAALELKSDKRDSPHRGAVAQALARVPRPQPLGAEGPLSITAVEPLAGAKPAYRVRSRSPEGATLFAEAPESWYLSTSPRDPTGAFTVTIEESPAHPGAPVPLTLTLVAGPQAIETEVSLTPALAAR